MLSNLLLSYHTGKHIAPSCGSRPPRPYRVLDPDTAGKYIKLLCGILPLQTVHALHDLDLDHADRCIKLACGIFLTLEWCEHLAGRSASRPGRLASLKRPSAAAH